MDTLPPELLEGVLDHCEFSSLKALRMTAKEYEHATTPRVFEHFYMACFNDCLENLGALAKSRLAKHVKRFTLYSDKMPSWNRTMWERNINCRSTTSALTSFRDIRFETSVRRSQYANMRGGSWANGLPGVVYISGSGYRRLSHARQVLCTWYPFVNRWPLSEDNNRPSHNFTTSQLDAGWEAFYRLSNERVHWREDHHGALFNEYFAMLPALVEANVETATPFQGLTGDWPVWRRMRDSMLVSRNDWILSEDTDDDADSAALCLQEAVGYRNSFAGTNPIRQLTVHTASDLRRAHWMISPRTNPLQLSNARDQRGDSLRSRWRYQVMREAYRHLTHITLIIDRGEPVEDFDDLEPLTDTSAFEHNTVDLLKASHQLRRLYLSFNDDKAVLMDNKNHDTPSALYPLFQTIEPWSYLADLSLSLDVSHMLLLPFLNIHSSTLKSLRLQDMIVFDAVQLLDNLPKILSLSSVYIQNIGHSDPENGALWDRYVFALPNGTDVDANYEKSVKSYLLRETQQRPEIVFHENRW